MKILQTLLLLTWLVLAVNAKAQDSTAVKQADTIKHVQVHASFPGGDAAWRRFLEKHMRTDVPIKNDAPPGFYEVKVSFLIAKDGSVTELKAVADPGYGTADEALRVFKKSPRWNPATQDGKPVMYRQVQTLTFAVYEQEGRKKKQ